MPYTNPVSSSDAVPRRPYASYDVVRIILGFTLVVVATLKSHGLLSDPALRFELPAPLWLMSLWVAAELGIGLWMLLGGFPVMSWIAALLCFVTFAGISLHQAVSGAESCGCFGQIELNPWLILLFDLSSAVVLGVCRPARSDVWIARLSPRALRRITVISVLVPIVSSVTLGIALFAATAAQDSNESVGGVRIFDPVRSIGKPFALLDSIDVGKKLAHGEWTAVLYSRGCDKCRTVLDRLDGTQSTDGTTHATAFIEIPPYGDEPDDRHRTSPAILCGRLKGRQEWFVPTPTILTLRNGYVVGVSESIGDAEENSGGRDWFAFGRAVGEQTKQNEGAPRLLSSKASPDVLRDVIAGGSYLVLAKLTNRHAEPVQIDSMRADCSCTVPERPREPIAPGDVAIAPILYRPKSLGRGSVGVLIVSNSGPATDFGLLRVHHHAVEKFIVAPASFIASDGLPTFLRSGAVWTIETANADWQIVERVITSHAGLDGVRLDKQEGDKTRRTYRLTVTPSAGLTRQDLRPVEVISIWFKNTRSGQFARMDLSIQGGEAKNALPWPVLAPQIASDESGVTLRLLGDVVGTPETLSASGMVLHPAGNSQLDSIPVRSVDDGVRLALPRQIRSGHAVVILTHGTLRSLIPVSLDGYLSREP